MMTGQDDTTEAAVEQAARAWMAAAMRRDLEVCGGFLSDAFTMVTKRGSLIDKSRWLVNMGRRVGGDTPPEFLDVRVRLYGDAALMPARTLLRATFDGKDWRGELYLTGVWVRRDGRWQLVRRHASDVVPGAA
jgi:ketosteroid isomerase-like protein